MTPLVLYLVAGVALFVAGFYSLVVRAHLVWKILALNIMAGGNFLILVAASPRLAPGSPDPVPQAMVLTGIVVSVATTALGLALALRVAARTGRPFLSEDLPEEEREEPVAGAQTGEPG